MTDPGTMHTPIQLQNSTNVVMQILVDWFHQRMQSRHKVAYMLPMYYLQRGRIAEALHAYTTVKDGFQGSQGVQLCSSACSTIVLVTLVQSVLFCLDDCRL